MSAARIRVPRGSGLWSAFWLLGQDLERVGWPACGEIDVMEHVTSDAAAVHGTLHGPAFSGLDGGIGSRHDAGVALSGGFHVHAVDWSPDRVTWLLDGVPYDALTHADVPGPWPFRQPFFLLLNLAVGGDWPGLAAEPPNLPATLDIDWVRLWKQPPANGTTGQARVRGRRGVVRCCRAPPGGLSAPPGGSRSARP